VTPENRRAPTIIRRSYVRSRLNRFWFAAPAPSEKVQGAEIFREVLSKDALVMKRCNALPTLTLSLVALTVGWTVEAAALTYVDKLGRTVEISVPVKRAVLFETYELAAHLGIWNEMVGISRYAYSNDLMQAVRPGIESTIPSAGSGLDVNIETLLKLKPDLVLTWTYKPDTVPFMEKKGLKVVAVYLESVAELYEVMRLLGRLFQKEEQVEDSIVLMEGVFKLIQERVSAIPEGEKKRVLWLGRSPSTVAGRTGIPQDTFTLMKGVNVAASIDGENADVSVEQIIAWNPDVIFIWGGAQYKSKDIKENPQWRNITAVRQGNVFKAPHWSRWSPRLALVSLWMAMRTYPDRFKDVDLETTAETFFQKLYGIPYRSVSEIED
jgi:iron complex transport system substrate-binding protein